MNNQNLIRSLLILVVALIMQCDIYSQNLEDRLSKAVKTCETTSINAQRVIVDYTIDQTDSIQNVLEIWNRECGNIEVVRRVEILLELQNDTFNYGENKSYFEDDFRKFINRINEAKENNFKERYERSKAYYGYVGLNSEFDAWTKNIALKILDENENQLPQDRTISLLLSENINEFEKAFESNEYEDLQLIKDYKSKYVYRRFYQVVVYLGARNPIGKMKENFSPSPQLGFGIKVPFSDKYSIELKAIFTRLINQEELVFNIENELINHIPTSTIAMGFNVSRELLNYKNKAFIELVTGINLGVVSTDIEKKVQKDNDKYHAAETVNLEIGLNLGKVVFKNKAIGLNLSMNYAPYNLDSQLVTEVGSLYFQTNAFFKF